MSITLKQISKWLDSYELNYEVKKESQLIRFGIGNDLTILHTIVLSEDGAFLQWFSQAIETSLEKDIQNTPYKEKLFEYLLFLNYQYKLGSWEYDYHDGDIRFYVAVPIEDGKMTCAQFERILAEMFVFSNEGVLGIIHVLNHGEFPKVVLEKEVLLTQI